MSVLWSGVDDQVRSGLEDVVSSACAEMGEVPCRVRWDDNRGSATVEIWRWHERVEAEASAGDSESAVREALDDVRRRVLAVAHLGLHETMDVAEVLARDRRFRRGGPVDEGVLRFAFGMRRSEAFARLRLTERDGLIFSDQDASEYAIGLRLPALADNEMAVITEPRLGLQNMAPGSTHALTFDVVGEDGATRRTVEIAVPVLPDVPSVVEVRQEILGMPHAVAIGRDLSDGLPYLVHKSSADEIRVYDYLHGCGEEVMDRIDGFPPIECVSIERTWRDVLMCPACETDLPWNDGDDLTCTGCGAVYPVKAGVPHFLTGELAQPTPHPEDSWNSNPTPNALRYFVLKHRGGVVMDCGAGDGTFRADNLINLEIFPFGNTTLVADGRRLPIRAGSLDGIISIAVIEHTPHPLEYCAELERVLRPGGELRIDSPFMVPYHACPDHYFNPTRSGLLEATKGIEPVWVGVGPHQSPFVALQAILELYIKLIPTREGRQRFRRTTVDEIVKSPLGVMPPEVRIPPGEASDLAAGIYLHGVRRGENGR